MALGRAYWQASQSLNPVVAYLSLQHSVPMQSESQKQTLRQTPPKHDRSG